MDRNIIKPFRTNAPFGLNSRRFSAIGFHPDLDSGGNMSKNKSALGPGQYNPENFECAYKKKCTGGSSWKRKVEVEEFSKNLGFRNSHLLKERQYWKAQGGPGSYEISEALFKRKSSAKVDNLSFGHQKRFHSVIKSCAPPPDTYFPNIMTMRRKRSTKLPPFEWDGFVPRFKDESPPWKKAPNCYDLKDRGSVAAIISRVISKRGPYDCFTGPRDSTTIKNYFAPPSFKGPLNWFNTWPNELEVLLNHPTKKRYGLFLKADRFPKKPSTRMMLADISMCYKDPDHPGPAHYFCDEKKEKNRIVNNKHPFNISAKNNRASLHWTVHPGPGRYNVKTIKCSKQKSLSWVFKSTTPRKVFG